MKEESHVEAGEKEVSPESYCLLTKIYTRFEEKTTEYTGMECGTP
jgi:hypothetical protein